MYSNMDTNEHDLEVIKNIIDKKPGCTYEDLFNESNLEKTVISRMLHMLISRVSIFKRDKYYYSVDVDKALIKPEVTTTNNVSKDAVRMAELRALEKTKKKKVMEAVANTNNTHEVRHDDVEIKTVVLHEVKQIEAEIKQVVINTVPKERLFGKLQRRGEKGIIAMFFYVNRNNEKYYSIRDIKELLKDIYTFKDMPNVLWNLAKDEMVLDEGIEGTYKRYKWSGKYVYPYRKMEEGDELIIPIKDKVNEPPIPSINEIDVLLHEKSSEVTKEPINNKLDEKHNVVLSIIESRIETLNAELKNLLNMKAVLVAA